MFPHISRDEKIGLVIGAPVAFLISYNFFDIPIWTYPVTAILFLVVLVSAEIETKRRCEVCNPPRQEVLPTISDYSDEIRHWQNEARRMESEMQARAKQAEQEEFERWLRGRGNG